MTRALLFGLLSFSLSACSASGPSTSPDRPSIDVDDVVVYTDADDLPDVYVVVTQLAPQPAPRYGRAADPIGAARRRAARLGANMLLVVEAGQELGDDRIQQVASQGGGAYSRLTFYALSTVADKSGARAAAPPAHAAAPLVIPDYIDVQVYSVESNIPTPYEVVGELSQDDIARYGVERDPLDGARQRAHELGANAVYVLTTGDEIADARIRTVVSQGGGFSRRRYIAVRIAADATTTLPSGN